jgi:hypothetical protein
MNKRWADAIVALGRLAWYGPSALLALLRFALRSGPRHERARRQALAALGAGLPSEHGEPLVQLFPRVHELRREYISALGLPGLASDALTFVHLNGTGEHLHSPLPGLERIFAHQPRLAAHRHLFVDIPDEAEAFTGADGFRDALDRTLSPITEGVARGVVLVGLSRGGIAAMHFGAAWAARYDWPVGVVALSPPLIGDYERPRTVRDIAIIERSVVQIAQIAKVMPAWLLRAQDKLLRRSYLTLTCFTLTEFAMDDALVLRWAAWDVATRAPIPAILRANREFAMLLKVSDEVLHDGCVEVAKAAAAHPRLALCMLWGADDTWVPTQRCAARARAIFAAAGVPAERAVIDVLAGFSHALSRQLTPDFSEVSAQIAKLTERVMADR